MLPSLLLSKLSTNLVWNRCWSAHSTMCVNNNRKIWRILKKKNNPNYDLANKRFASKVGVNFKPCLWVFLCHSLCVLQHFIIGAHVSLGPWLGTVTEVYRRVVIMLKNGSRYSNLITQTRVLNQ